MKVNHNISDEKPAQSQPMIDISNLPLKQARDECAVSVPIANETCSIFTDKSSLIMNSIPNLDTAIPKKSKKNLFNFKAKDKPYTPFIADLKLLDSITNDENFDQNLDKFIEDEIDKEIGPVLQDTSHNLNDERETSFVDVVTIEPISTSNEAPIINCNPINIAKESAKKSPLVNSISNEGSGKDNSVRVIATGHTSSSNESVLISANTVHTSNGVFASSTPQKDASPNSGTEVEKPMKKILEATQKGRRVLSYFQSHSKLNSAKRALLCGVLIDHAMNDNPNAKLNSKDFFRLAALVVEFFPKEKTETYYVPFVPKTGRRKRKLASGKLWHKYTNTCKELRDDGLRAFQSSNSEEEASLSIVYNLGRSVLMHP